ncbi:SDR family NAD(P)-dependent oxidoreductase [Nocardia seriolae]|uniref:Short-chain dehydrogenase n=1 Tax=Nocardia seriolae TaxID=37332 RepID=A0ABC9Z4L8_9NOCA|nr:SDR family NAD(P)-dependent oxidoreductase [Nocardia seriolae]BEK92545.1 hypothetical protein NSER024013_04510 [Nocardia seriolae]GAM50755.1 short-chain dehydrogenase [Nocardia seriolae]GAP32747.1 short-chain dehydrogenase [Nocardia seriolae]
MQELSGLLHKIRHGLDTQVSLSRLRRNRTLADAVGGRTVLITGASSGIGRAAALELGAAGATVLLVARRADELDRVVGEIETAGGRAAAYPCDLNDFDALDAVTANVLADHGRADILVNNAGRSIRRRLDESYDRFHDYERTMRLNYFAAVRLILAFAPAMRANGGGQIVNILSLANLYGGPGYAAYVASKAALDSLATNLQAETHTENLRFTSIYLPPGPHRHDHRQPGLPAGHRQRPHPRGGRPDHLRRHHRPPPPPGPRHGPHRRPGRQHLPGTRRRHPQRPLRHRNVNCRRLPRLHDHFGKAPGPVTIR